MQRPHLRQGGAAGVLEGQEEAPPPPCPAHQSELYLGQEGAAHAGAVDGVDLSFGVKGSVDYPKSIHS